MNETSCPSCGYTIKTARPVLVRATHTYATLPVNSETYLDIKGRILKVDEDLSSEHSTCHDYAREYIHNQDTPEEVLVLGAIGLVIDTAAEDRMRAIVKEAHDNPKTFPVPEGWRIREDAERCEAGDRVRNLTTHEWEPLILRTFHQNIKAGEIRFGLDRRTPVITRAQ